MIGEACLEWSAGAVACLDRISVKYVDGTGVGLCTVLAAHGWFAGIVMLAVSTPYSVYRGAGVGTRGAGVGSSEHSVGSPQPLLSRLSSTDFVPKMGLLVSEIRQK